MKDLAQATVELNEYIERFNEIKPHLDAICENIFIERVHVENDGCDQWLQRKVIKYLEDHDIIVSFSDK